MRTIWPILIAFGGLAKDVAACERQEAPQHACQRRFVDRQRRLARGAPYPLVGIREQAFAHFGEQRPAVGAVLIRHGHIGKTVRAHGDVLLMTGHAPD